MKKLVFVLAVYVSLLTGCHHLKKEELSPIVSTASTKYVDARIGVGLDSLKNARIVLIVDGNSTGFGTGSSKTQYTGKWLQDWLKTRCDTVVMYSFCKSGQTLLDMLHDTATQVYPKITTDTNWTYVVIANEDINGIINHGQTAQQNFDNFKKYFYGAKKRSAGTNFFSILYTSPLPRWTSITVVPPDTTFHYTNATWTNTMLIPQVTFMNMVDTAINVPWSYSLDLRQLTYTVGGYYKKKVVTKFNADSVHDRDPGYTSEDSLIANVGFRQIWVW